MLARSERLAKEDSMDEARTEYIGLIISTELHRLGTIVEKVAVRSTSVRVEV